MEDIWRVIRSLRGKNIDILMTCGNAGDVRKGISASKILGIPNFHIEQDIYNPIEMIAFSNPLPFHLNIIKTMLLINMD